jgi:hypothetical protein
LKEKKEKKHEIKFFYGNDHELIQVSEQRANRPRTNKHKWTAFVRCEKNLNLNLYIKKVKYLKNKKIEI